MTSTRQRGAAIEAAARDYLQRAGLREVAANANYRFGELDLVMLDKGRLDKGRLDEGRLDQGPLDDRRLDDSRHERGGRGADVLVFVEVRYRRDSGYGGGAASIDAGKRRRLVRAAQAFLAAHRAYANTPCRFDVIEAGGDPAEPELRWLKDAFRVDDPA